MYIISVVVSEPNQSKFTGKNGFEREIQKREEKRMKTHESNEADRLPNKFDTF